MKYLSAIFFLALNANRATQERSRSTTKFLKVRFEKPEMLCSKEVALEPASVSQALLTRVLTTVDTSLTGWFDLDEGGFSLVNGDINTGSVNFNSGTGSFSFSADLQHIARRDSPFTKPELSIVRTRNSFQLVSETLEVTASEQVTGDASDTFETDGLYRGTLQICSNNTATFVLPWEGSQVQGTLFLNRTYLTRP